MRWLRKAVRLGRLGGHLVLGAVLAALLLAGRGSARSPRRARLIRWWHRGACRALGVEVVVRGTPAPGPVLLACNHVSWLDILVLGAVVQTRFVAKAEVRGWPLLGWLAARAGTLFLKRGDRGAAEAATLEMVWALRRGASVALFPEGTTSDGRGVRRFRARLFDAAVLAGAPVQPVALRFRDGDRLCPRAPFVGDDDFVPHLVRLAGHGALRAELTFLEPVKGHSGQRERLAQQCEARVRAALEGPPAARLPGGRLTAPRPRPAPALRRRP
jgi:1-acyl-sn-glycerol-3-phosphate acyltransferase